MSKKQSIWYRERAEKMDNLTKEGWTYEQLARRFCLSVRTIKLLLKIQRETEKEI
jgi:transposase